MDAALAQMEAEDYSAALSALRRIATHIARKTTLEIPRTTWAASGLPRGSTGKAVNVRIHLLKTLASANKETKANAESAPRSDRAPVRDSNWRRNLRSTGWSKRLSRLAGRDAKVLRCMVSTGELDLDCDRLYFDSRGGLHAASEVNPPVRHLRRESRDPNLGSAEMKAPARRRGRKNGGAPKHRHVTLIAHRCRRGRQNSAAEKLRSKMKLVAARATTKKRQHSRVIEQGLRSMKALITGHEVET